MKVELKNIHKAFGSNRVLKGVDFELLEGEVHSLVGENGAGKSTLMNIVTGLVDKSDGQILVNGQEVQFANPKDAENNGISFIHQELVTWPEMTILENIFLGKEYANAWGYVNNKQMAKDAEEILNELSISFDLNRQMKELSVGQQQLIEIAKTLLNKAQVIIMDEPTAALTDREINLLFDIIRRLTLRGVSIVYISHRMKEIFELSDRVTVMRDGVSVMTKKIEDTNNQEIVNSMVGREIEDYYPDIDVATGEVILQVDGLSSNQLFEDISFKLHEGEILAFSGLMGSGRTEIMRAIFGIDSYDAGKITVQGEEVAFKHPSEAIAKGIGFLTENRKEEGLILDFSIKDNISLTALDEFSHNGHINVKEEEKFVELLIKRLVVKTTSMHQAVSSLSGGNQQKVVLAKWVGAGTQILILDEPTRGVDVGAKREIYILMKELAQRGVGIIMVSSDLPEVIGISDRVIVIHEGRINGQLLKNELTEERIMTYATGGQ